MSRNTLTSRKILKIDTLSSSEDGGSADRGVPKVVAKSANETSNSKNEPAPSDTTLLTNPTAAKIASELSVLSARTASKVTVKTFKATSDNTLKNIPKNPSKISRFGMSISEQYSKGAAFLTRSSISDDGSTQSTIKVQSSISETSKLNLDIFADSYMLQKSLAENLDYFGELGGIPDIEDISEYVSRESLIEKSMNEIHEKFVDPITGKSEEASLDKEDSKISAKSAEKETPSKRDTDDEYWRPRYDECDDEELLAILAPDEEEKQQKRVTLEDDSMKVFREGVSKKQVTIDDEVDAEALERRLEIERLKEVTADFLERLIRHVATTCEYIDPDIILRQNLNKETLMNEMRVRVVQLEEERRKLEFVNRKVGEYFRRKNSMRMILDDNPSTVIQDKKRFREALNRLDILLTMKKEKEEVSEQKIKDLNDQVLIIQEQAKENQKDFEELVRTTLGRETSEYMNSTIRRELGKMEHMREEVSEVRFRLVLKSHTAGKLQEKIKELENIGNGLNMLDFQFTQAETMALDKRIEERNAELMKLRNRFNAEYHKIAHLREKRLMLHEAATVQKSALRILIEEQKSWREYLVSLKIKRSKIRNELDELSFQCGLLDKPALMKDYDQTVDQLEMCKERVGQIRAKYNATLKKIQELEQICTKNL